jgi:site-specific DNA-methyltransferase (adenine-specific)
MLQVDTIFNGDCLDVMKDIDCESIDMILCDLPYEITSNIWDKIIPFEPLWNHYKRIIKKGGNIILTASQPFTTQIINSNFGMFRYALVWDKVGTAGFLTAKKRPLQRHEDICVFYSNFLTYNPQKEIRGKPRKKGGYSGSSNYGGVLPSESTNNEYYPTSIITISNASQVDKIHPTQKPIDLFSYLIKTYSNEGDIVLDNCSGSGTTAISCIDTKRKYICIEKDFEYYEKSLKRVKERLEKIIYFPSIIF